MAIKFEKDGTDKEFDGFDPKTRYQMIPVGGARDISIITESDCVLEIKDPRVARMVTFISVSGPNFAKPALGIDKITLPAKSKVNFSLSGLSVGHTELSVSGPDGHLQEALLLSVKNPLVKKYALCFLRDIRRSTLRTKTEAQGFMNLVAKTFLQQANVDLQLLPPHADVVVPKDLNDPLVVSSKPVFTAIVDATPREVIAADILIYCCWDVIGDSGAERAITKGFMCFVEDGGDPRKTAPLIFAHEVGHALGLEHSGNDKHLMFENTGARSSKLAQFEIDQVNPSGTVPFQD